MGNAFRCLGFISMPGGGEWLILGILGLLLFGKRLPEVAKSLGRSVTEFKRGLYGLEQEIDQSVEEQARLLPPSPRTHGNSVLPDPAGSAPVNRKVSPVKPGP